MAWWSSGGDYGLGKLADVYRPTRDTPAPMAASRGWPVDLAETDTDHAGIVMTEYDESARRYRPTTAPHAIAGGLLSARTIAQAAAETVGDATAQTTAGAAGR